jgi:hypothetical protein
VPPRKKIPATAGIFFPRCGNKPKQIRVCHI